MREIKFRGWYIGPLGSRMLEPEFHGPINEIFNDPDNEGRVIYMQYTGLKDKNGKEIFEGDIVKTHNQYNVVKYELGSFMLVGLHEDEYERTYAHLKSYLIDITISGVEGSKYDGITTKLEIIGNIHENPELREVTE